MTRLVFDWPDEAGEAVRAARGRLSIAADALRARDFEARLQSVANVIEAWSEPDSPWRRELSDQLAAATPFHPDTIEEGLESGLRAWSRDPFVDCARREIIDAMPALRRTLVPFESTSVLAGGSIPMPTLLSALLPLVLGSSVLLRETTKDPVTGTLLQRSIAASDLELARCLEVVRFPAEDTAALETFLESPCVVATGSDETIASIRARLDPGQRFVAYAHRFSIGILGPETDRDPAALESMARGLALDVARWDQSGCLSPVVVYLVGLSATSRLRVAERVADALEDLSASRPRGRLGDAMRAAHATERAEARMRAASLSGVALFEGSDFTLSLEADSRPRPAPLARFLRLLPVASLSELEGALAPFSRHLSSAALAGFDPPDAARLTQRISRYGLSRFTTAGRLQTPPVDWPHDGLPLFVPMARFAVSEPSASETFDSDD